MAAPRVLVLLLAGGAGSRLERLTDDRAKPAVPFGGPYRLVDVALSNCRNSGLSDVWVVQQQHPASLAEALANGRPWDLDRTTGGLLVLPPALGTDRDGWHRGTADALWKQTDLIREFAPDALVVLSADGIYRMDLHDVVMDHLASDAAVTIVTVRVDAEDASRYGVVEVDGAGAVRGYAYKPDDPASDLVANEVFVFDPTRALDTLEAIADEVAAEAEEDDDRGDELGDLGDHLLPRLVDAGAAREHRFDGYWRDVGTVQAYLDGHLDLVGPEPAFVFDDDQRPILSSRRRTTTARFLDGARVVDAEVSGGAVIAGVVIRSVVGPGAVVERGAEVVDSVLLPGAVVRTGAHLTRTIVDSDLEVPRDVRAGGDGEVTLLGRGADLAPGDRVPAGAILPPDDEGDAAADELPPHPA